jgi:hypothetical protein
MNKVIHISKIDTKELFETKAYLLGTPQSGDWFVVSGDTLYLGRYEAKENAQEHADSLNKTDENEDIVDNL